MGPPVIAADPISVRHLLRKRIMLAFDLVNAEGPNLGDRLNGIVNGAQFQNHVQQVVQQQLGQHLKGQMGMWGQGGPPVSQIPKAIFKPVPKMLLDSIKTSPHYQRLDSSIAEMETEWKQTPCGIWIGEHPNGAKWLAITGSMLSIAGLAAAYTPKRADFVAKHLVNNKKFDIVKTGVIDMNVSGEMKPSAKELGIASEWHMKLDALDVKANLSANVKGGLLQDASYNSVIKIPLGKMEGSIKISGGTDKDSQAELGLNGKAGKWQLGSKFTTDGSDNNKLALEGSGPLGKGVLLKSSVATDFEKSHSFSLFLENDPERKAPFRVSLGVAGGSQQPTQGQVRVILSF